MKLIYRVTLRLALVLLPVLLLWAAIFYYAMVEEINDETDDSLEDYAELIIRRTLTGQELPSSGDGTNNTYSIELLPDTAFYSASIEYKDQAVYIPEKRETEPARLLTMVFLDAGGGAYRVTVSTPTFERDDLLKAILLHLGVLYLALIITLFAVVALVFHYSMRPLYSLLKWLDGYRPGQGVEGFPAASSTVEFKKLTQAARSTIERAEQYFERQKQFTGNASHELQTPLAILSTRIEWLMDKTSLTEEQFAELSKMRQSLNRLIKLNRTLLLLSKIDNGQFADKSDVDIVELIKSEQQLYSEVFEYKEIDCQFDLPDKYIVNINDSLATTLITNLLKNAYQHSPAGATINVRVNNGVLEVSNTGSDKLNEERLYDRFYTSGESGSTGLGLALVKSIAGYYGFELSYCFTNSSHCFAVRLKI